MRLNILMVEDSKSDYDAIENHVMQQCAALGMRLGGNPFQDPSTFLLARAQTLEGARNAIEDFAQREDAARANHVEYPGLLIIFDILLLTTANESLATDYITTLLHGLPDHPEFQPRVIIYSAKLPEDIRRDRNLKKLVPTRDIFWKFELMEPAVLKAFKKVIEQAAR